MTIELIQGDCVEEMTKMREESIDLTVTSPPYDNLRTYEGSLQWNEGIWKQVLEGLYRVTKQGGVVVWVVGDATIKGSETGTSFKQALYAKGIGFNLHDTMIWQKDTFSAVGALKTRYAPVFEYMFIFSKGNISTFNPIKDRKNKYAGDTVHGKVRQSDGTTRDMVGKNVKIIADFGQRWNIWKQPAQRQRGKDCHPAPFPEQLAHDHILSWSNKGDTVFDPFLGSGTTGFAAKQLKRSFIGIEKINKYFEIAKERIDNDH
jgi:site-specific DNA-methyltransferase (adenine-specific)